LPPFQAHMTATAAAKVDADERVEKAKPGLQVIFASSSLHMFGVALTMQANQTIWLDHYKGDFAAQAKATSALMALMQGLGLAVNPVLAAASDSIGRKPIVLFGVLVAILTRLQIAARPGVAALKVNAYLMAMSMGHKIGLETALGDMFAGDGKGYGGAMAKLMFGPVVSMTVCPILGSILVERYGVAAPYAIATALEAGTLAMDAHLFKETLPVEERKPFSLGSANPLSFLQLFRHGPSLSLLAVMRVLNFACDKMNIYTVMELYRQQKLNYGMRERAMVMSMSSLLAMPGFALAGTCLRRFGTQPCLWLGLGAQALEALLLPMCTSIRGFYALLPLGMLRVVAGSAIQAMLQDEVGRTSMRQGEFQGCVANLNTLTQVMATILWARLYAFGVRRGQPGLWLRILALCCGAQWMLERGLVAIRSREDKRQEQSLSELMR